MIHPRYIISQDAKFIKLVIDARYSNVANAQIEFDGPMLLFSSPPYFLRVDLRCEIVDDAELHCQTDYDAETGEITVKVPKKSPHDWANLDQLLLETVESMASTAVSAKPAVEEVGEDVDQQPEVDDAEVSADQKLPEPEKAPETTELTTYGYGFGWQRHDVFSRFDEDIVKKLLSLPNPETFAIDERVNCCVQVTASEFNSEHYLADLLEPSDQLKQSIAFEVVPSKHFEITQDDRDRMKDLPVRRVLPAVDDKVVAYSLVDIIAAYLYDFRFTEGEDNVESGWTISQLSPSLTFLVRWTSAQEAVVGFARRAVTRPCYRSWLLINAVLKDLVSTLKEGRSALLHILLQIKRIMNLSGDFRYLLNDLFITDYCLWIQKVGDAVLKNVADEVDEAVKNFVKADLDCDLEQLELDASLHLMNLNSSDKKDDEIVAPQPPLDSDDEAP